MDKTKADVMLSNLAGLDSKETTDAMQAFFNQFDLGTKNVEKDAMMISDSMVAVSKSMAMNFSQGIREMIEGVKVSGSIAKEAGMDLQHYEALIGTVAQVTRASGSEIGNAWKTILSRMGRVKPTTKEGIENINKCEKALNSVGVKLRSDKNTFRDTGNVLDDLAKKWNGLSQAQRSQIAEEAAGVRQKGYFLALMNHYSTYTDLATKAINSQGEAERANAIYLESTEAKMKLLTNATQEFFGAALKSNDLKAFIELLTDIVHVSTFIVDKFGLIGTAAGVMSAKMLLSNNAFKNLITEMKTSGSVISTLSNRINQLNSTKATNLVGSFVNLKHSLNEVSNTAKIAHTNIINGISKGEIAIKKFNGTAKIMPRVINETVVGSQKLGVIRTIMRDVETGTQRATLQINLLGKSFRLAAIGATIFEGVATMGLSLLVAGIVGGISKLISKAHEGKQSMQEMMATLPDRTNQINSLDAMANKMDYLSKKAHLNANEQEQLHKIQQQMAQQNPSLISGYDSQGRAIATNAKAVRDLVTQKRNLLQAELRSSLNSQQSKIADETKKYEESKRKVMELSKELREHQAILKNMGLSEQEVAKRTKSYSDNLSKQAKVVRDSGNAINQYKSTVSSLNKLEYDSAKAIINNINANKNKKASIDEVKKALETQGISANVAKNALKDYETGTLNAADGNKELKGDVEDVNNSLKEQANELSGLSGKIDFYQKVLDELKEHNAVSRDTFNTVIEKFPELIPILANAATAQSNLQKMIANTGKTYNDMANSIMDNAQNIQKANEQAAQNSANAVSKANSNITNSAQQTGNNISNIAANTSNNVSNNSANATNNLANDMNITSNNANSTGNDISNTSANTANNVSNDSANTTNDLANDMDNTADNAANAGDNISNTSANTSDNVKSDGSDAAQSIVDSMDGAVDGMGQAYGTDVQNFNNACNAKIDAANQAAQAIANAFNAVIDQMGKNIAAADNSSVFLDHNMKLQATKPDPGVVQRQQQMADWAKAAHNMQSNMTHISTGNGGHVNVGYSPSSSRHSAGGGGGGRKKRGSGGGGGSSPRHSSGSGGSHRGGSGSSGSKSSKQKVEDLQLEIDRAKIASANIEDINNQISHLQDMIDNADGTDKIPYIKQQVAKINQLLTAYQKLKSVQVSDKDSLKNKLSKNWFKFDSNDQITDYENTLKRLQNWANSASGQEKERRKKVVQDLVGDADKYIDLVSTKINDTDNAIYKENIKIQELLKEQAKIKLDDLKKHFDDTVNNIQRKAKGLDVWEAMYGNKSYENNLDFLKHRIKLADKEFQAKFKYMNDLKKLAKESGKNFDELSDAIRDSEDGLDESKIKVQQLKEQYEKLNLEWEKSAFDDFKWQTQQKLDELNLSMSKLTDSDTVGKMNLLNQKLRIQQSSLQRTKDYIEQLRKTVIHTAKGYEEFISKLKEAKEELNSQKNAVQDLEQQMEGLVKDKINKYIEQMRKIEELQLERKQKQEQIALEKKFFGISESEFNRYKASRIGTLNQELDLLRRKYELEGAEPAILDEIKAKSIELRDIEQQRYDTIGKEVGEWKKLHEALYKQKIKLIDKQLEAMDEEDKKNQEKEERLKRQNELLKIQEQMENIKKNHNIRELTKEKGGKWQFKYTYDRQAYDKAQEDYNQKKDDLAKWEKEVARNKIRDKLNKEKEFYQKALDDLSSLYDSKKEVLDKMQDQERDLLEKKYDDMDSMTEDYMKKLKSTYGNGWDGMLSDMDNKLGKGKKLLQNFNNEIVSQVSSAQAKLKDLMGYMGDIKDGNGGFNFRVNMPSFATTIPRPQAMSFAGISVPQDQPVQQNISVNANFPNATNSNDIERALSNLSNDTIQYVNKRK